MMMEQEHKPIKDEGDLESMLGRDLMEDPAPTLEASVDKVPSLWRYRTKVLASRVGTEISAAYDATKKLVKAAVRFPLYYGLGGGRPAQLQERSEENHGSDYYNPAHASFANAVITAPLAYAGIITAVALSPLPDAAKLGITIPLGIYGLVESVTRGFISSTFSYYPDSYSRRKHHEGRPIGSALFYVPAWIAQGASTFLRGVRDATKRIVSGLDEEALRLQRDYASGKVDL